MTRVLYVDIDARFVNPTRSLVPAALAMGCETTFFGPGHVDSDRLRRGLVAFLDETGPYQIVATNSHLVMADIYDPPPEERDFRRHYAFSFPGRDVLELPRIAAELETIDLPRVGIFLESDYYDWTGREIDRLDRRIDVAIGFAPPFWGPLSEMPGLAAEAFAAKATDAWYDWLAANPTRAVPMLPMIGDGEFCYRPLVQRPSSWSVLGIGYAARARAVERLESVGLRPLPSTSLRRALGAMKRLGVIPSETDLAIGLLNRDFRRRLARTRYSYTCGSGLRMPIRKFFEIPAAGAVLVCTPFAGFAAAGFTDGVSAIVCEPDDVVEVHRFLEKNPDTAQSIADSGRALVARRHSIAARAGQFATILGGVARGDLPLFTWREGELAEATSPGGARP